VKWRENNTNEIKMILNNSNNIKKNEVITRQKNNDSSPTEHTADENTRQKQQKRQ
jgi:hypothetical protein